MTHGKKIQPRNPDTKRAHRTQTFWQILLPIFAIVISVLITGILFLIARMNGGDAIVMWAHISTIWISLPILIFLVMVIGVVFLINYGLTKAIRALPGLALRIQTHVYRAAVKIRTLSDKSISPFMTFHETGTAFRAFFKGKKKALTQHKGGTNGSY